MVLSWINVLKPAKTMLFIEEADPLMERWYTGKVTMSRKPRKYQELMR